jgi:processive 1,2-diacylglycerol beta-glucosyltransferase/1,2-diacylglycerol 3-beta-galactosyltransferase
MNAKKEKERILFLYLKAGGGHYSGALALSSCLEEKYSDRAEGYLLDGLPENELFVRGIIEDGYRITSNFLVPLYAASYEISKLSPIMKGHIETFSKVSADYIADCVRALSITKIVVLHFFLLQPSQEAVSRLGLRIPIITVVMDPFTTHPMWFYQKRGTFIVFSEKMKRWAVDECGVEEEDIHVFPIILKRAYDSPMPASGVLECKRRFGFRPEKKLLLLAGGGEGLPNGDRYLEYALKEKLNADIAIVCGRNKLLKFQADLITKRFKNTHVKVYEFVDFMYQLMNMSDVIVTKGGPATVMEALILEKPLILVDYIYGQEKGNVDYVVEHQAGFFIRNPKKAMEKVKSLLEDPKSFEEMKRNIRSLDIRNGTEEIVDFILTRN